MCLKIKIKTNLERELMSCGGGSESNVAAAKLSI